MNMNIQMVNLDQMKGGKGNIWKYLESADQK